MQDQEGPARNYGDCVYCLKGDTTFERFLSVIVCVNCDPQQPFNQVEVEEVVDEDASEFPHHVINKFDLHV